MNRLLSIALALGTFIVFLNSKTYSEEASETVIDASAFGAVPDDGKDDFVAIRAALAACQGKPHPRLVLAPGVYNFTKMTQPDRRVFEATEIDDLTIDGQGATLIFSGRANPFFFKKCRNLKLKNVKIDWDRVPFSQGTVVASTEESIDVEVDPAFPLTGQEKIEALMDYDPETRLPLANLDIFAGAIQSVEPTGPQSLRITFKHTEDPLKRLDQVLDKKKFLASPNVEKAMHKSKYIKALTGKLVVLRHEVYGSFAIDLDHCENVSLENVSIYACPGMGIHAGATKDITCDRVEVRIKPGSGRLMSTTADCQYYTFCSGTITLRDGYYEGMGDDGLNVTSKYRAVTKVASPTSILAAVPSKVPAWQGEPPAPGEKLVFQSGADMKPMGTATVKASVWDPNAKAFSIQFEQPLPGLKENDLFYSETYMPKVRVSNCTFQGMRSRAILLSTRDAKITDCKIRGPGYAGVFLKGGLRHGVEGPASSDVEIRNCTFEGCGGAAIYAYADGPGRPAGALERIVIEGNTIRAIPKLAAQRFAKDHPGWMHWSAGICLLSTKDGRIANNVFENAATAIFLFNDDGIVIEGNRSNPPAAVVVDEATCKSVTIGGTNEGLKLQPATEETKPDLQYVNDIR